MPQGTEEVLERWERREKGFFVCFVLVSVCLFACFVFMVLIFFWGHCRDEGRIWVDWEVNRIRVYDVTLPKNQ